MIKVLIHTDSRYPVNRKIIRQAILETFFKNKVGDLNAEISVAVVGWRKMINLSEKFLRDNQKHGVLAFAIEDAASRQEKGFINIPDGILRLGDVVLCWPYVLELTAVEDKMVDDEVYFLTAHGVEHLLGKHHE